jgi:hypothetical protein
VDTGALSLTSIERLDWSDGFLGCPEDGKLYTQAIVPGFRLIFEGGGETLEVHSDLSGSQMAGRRLLAAIRLC